MAIEATCAGCGKRWRVAAAERKYKCRDCGGTVSAETAAAPAAAPPDAGGGEAVAAPATAPADPAAAPEGVAAAPVPPRRVPARGRRDLTPYLLANAQREHRERSRSAMRWLAGVGVASLIFGIFSGIVANREAETARKILADMDADEVVSAPDLGERTVGQLREELGAEVRRTWAINLLLPAAFIALAFWSRKAPLPAAITGLSLYLVILVVNFVIEPSTLFKGMVVKVLFIMAMLKAISSAVSEQAWLKAARAKAAAEPAPEPAALA
jgi:hypothetical protein